MAERERYCGIENEYVLYATDQRGHSIENCAAKMIQNATDNNRKPAARGFNSVGAMCYIDMGDHPEYATPESIKPEYASTHDMIGEEYMISAFSRFFGDRVHYLEPDHEILGVLSKKNTSDDSSWGVHESYQVLRENFNNLEEPHIYQSLETHLISRIIYTGAGGYIHRKYCISPRALFHHNEINSKTTGSNDARPIINTKDETLVNDGDRWRRLHIITGEGNMSPWANRMKLESTSLVAKAMEEGELFDDLCPKDPVTAFKIFATDESLSRVVNCNDNQKRDAIKIQSDILERVKKYVETDNELEATDEWEQALRSLERLKLENKMVKFLHSIDWIARRKLIEDRKHFKGLTPVRLDFLYDKLIDDKGRRGVGSAFREQGKYRLTPDDWSLKSIEATPSSPRAQLRGTVVRLYGHELDNEDVSWLGAKPETHGYVMHFPDNPTPEQSQEYLREYAKAFALAHDN